MAARKLPTGNGTVKAVLSGDTLVVVGPSKGGPPPEIQLSLAHLRCPRVSRHPDATDEPFAWPAREFLRKLCVGKQVRFVVEWRNDSGRNFSSVYMGKTNLCVSVAAEGWGVVDDETKLHKGKIADYDEMVRVSAVAQANKRGQFNPDSGAAKDSIRQAKWSMDEFEAEEFVKRVRGKAVEAIVEFVRGGASLRCYVPEYHQYVNINMAGIAAPKMNTGARPKRPAETKGEEVAGGGGGGGGGAGAAGGIGAAATAAAAKPEPFAAQAKHFTEMRLLQRGVTLHIRGAGKFGIVYGDVEHPAGSIAVLLAKSGFARMVDYSLSYTANAVALRSAEREAKEARLRLWQNYVPRVIAGDKTYKGKVVEVPSGDTIVVLVSKGTTQEERRVSFSSLRVPRLGRRGAPDEPYAWNAQEFVRRAVIGREVAVHIDYKRDAPEGAEGPAAKPRMFATVTLPSRKGGINNIAVAVLQQGYGTVMMHRVDDDRARDYDDMKAAETTAMEAKKGMHSSKDPPKRRIADLTSDAHRAKGQLPFLQRAGTMRAVVDYVFGGGRVKLTIPKENTTCMFALSGVKCPAVGRATTVGPDGKKRQGRKEEPCGPEALALMRELVMQRDVEVDIATMDARGSMLGRMWLGQGPTRMNIGVELLRRGLGRMIEMGARRVAGSEEMEAAEAEARAARRGLWVVETARVEAEEKAEKGEEVTGVTVSEIVSAQEFYIQADIDAGKLDRVNAAMKELLDAEGAKGAPCDPKIGSVLACVFDDGSGAQFFRARIVARNLGADVTFNVLYIDYGISENVRISSLRPCPDSVAKIPPIARCCRLAFLRVPSLGEENGREAAELLSELAFRRRLISNVISRDSGNVLDVTLAEEGATHSVGEVMLREGVCRIAATVCFMPKKRTGGRRKIRYGLPEDVIKSYMAAEDYAKTKRNVMWYLGDVGDSDNEM